MEALVDPDHFGVHAILGKLYGLQKDTETAIISYRMGIAGQRDGFFISNALARLYLRQGQWEKAVQEVLTAVKMIPGDLRIAGRRSWRRPIQTIKDRF